ncbi:MAG: DUF1553 domain-containing protein [Pirellulaceae bacterium]
MRTLLAIAVLLGCSTVSRSAETEAIDFRRDIEPIFARHCVRCHGADKQQSGLRLDDRQNLLRGGDFGEPTIVPGDSAASFLISAVSGENVDLRMPPEGDLLSKQQVDKLKAWIDQGAKMPTASFQAAVNPARELWSLRPLRPVRPPRFDDAWIANPIDAFVVEKLQAKGLSPSPPCNTATLARRVHLVMHGLPPSREQLARWEAASSLSGKDESLIEGVLQSPHYGERWAQHWLDVIRWGETAGFETNAPRPNAWPYRDWVIDSLNADKPFDRFVFEQIAGDTVGQDAALGFLVAGPANLPGQIGRDEESMRQARQDELDEVIRTVGQAFLGLTIGCARCHSHKFDPITQRDYYALQAMFAGLSYGERRLRGPENDRWTAQTPQAARRVAELTEELEAARESLGLREPLADVQSESFEPLEAKAVRMTIEATGDGNQASLYEFEIWTTPDDGRATNVALAELGGRATASSFALENQTRHPDNLNDGTVDRRQAYPWKAAKAGPAWIQVDLARPALVDRVVWHRGASTPADYEIAVQLPDDSWRLVADTRDRQPRLDDVRKAADVKLTASPAETERLASLIARLRSAQREHTRLAAGPQVFAARFEAPEATWLLRRGDPMQRTDQLAPAIPAALGDLELTLETADSDRRLALARFLGGPDNPLTARVIVNRIWQHHFGTGLVDTPSDFGRMGSRPTHPELLDWLAVELIQNGWSLKHIHRLILTSNTFRQASTPRDDALRVDADSRLLWRFPPRRLDAEALRDSILLASGKLRDQRGGAGFDFFNQRGGLSDYVPKETFDESGWRRMIYAHRVRMQTIDVFGSFDCPDAGQMTPSRNRSITPIQALNLLNSRFVNRQAAFFAERVREEADSENVEEQVRRAMLIAFTRPPSAEELQLLSALAREHGLEQVCRALLNANEFVFLQ